MGARGLVLIGFFWVSGGIYGNEALGFKKLYSGSERTCTVAAAG